MTVCTPDVITRYFAAQSARDWVTLVSLFADDAVVVDEGRTRRGIREIRSWRENVASTFEYTTDVNGIEAVDERMYVGRVHLEGNFPGGTADLEYHFTIEDGQIRRLEIGP